MLEEIFAGVVGGTVATALMTALIVSMMPERPLPPQVLVSKLGKRAPAAYRGWGLVLHFVYGAVMGVAFALLIDTLLDPVADYSAGRLVLFGIVWGLALWIVFLLWSAVLGLGRTAGELEGVERVMARIGPLVGHVLYGGILGGVVAALLDTLPPGTF